MDPQPRRRSDFFAITTVQKGRLVIGLALGVRVGLSQERLPTLDVPLGTGAERARHDLLDPGVDAGVSFKVERQVALLVNEVVPASRGAGSPGQDCSRTAAGPEFPRFDQQVA